MSVSLVGSELNHLPLEKLVFAPVIVSRKLRHYFDAHPIKVLTFHSIRASLCKFDLVKKWRNGLSSSINFTLIMKLAQPSKAKFL